MAEIEVVTTSARSDLHEQAGAAFRGGWPLFIFHDPVPHEYVGRVEECFPEFDPLTPMDQFAGWARADGLHLDPWIRTHQRLGATILVRAPDSMIVIGTVPEWEDGARMTFPQTGTYVVPQALDPVEIDRERNVGTYHETNLWVRHL